MSRLCEIVQINACKCLPISLAVCSFLLPTSKPCAYQHCVFNLTSRRKISTFSKSVKVMDGVGQKRQKGRPQKPRRMIQDLPKAKNRESKIPEKPKLVPGKRKLSDYEASGSEYYEDQDTGHEGSGRDDTSNQGSEEGDGEEEAKPRSKGSRNEESTKTNSQGQDGVSWQGACIHLLIITSL